MLMLFLVLSGAIAVFGICLTAWIVSRWKNRGWKFCAGAAMVAVVAYPLGFGPASRLMPRERLATVYRPFIFLALKGPKLIRRPILRWVDTCGGSANLTLLAIEGTLPPETLPVYEEVIPREVQIGEEIGETDLSR